MVPTAIPKSADGFDSQEMHGFFPRVKEVEDIDPTNQPWNRNKAWQNKGRP
jgi:hypothetical protein